MFWNSCLLGSTEFASQAKPVPQLPKIWTSLLVFLVAGGFFLSHFIHTSTAHFVLIHPNPASPPLMCPTQPPLLQHPHRASPTGSPDLDTNPPVKLGWRLLRGCISTKLQIQLLFLSVWCSLILDWGRFCSLNQGHSTSTIPDIDTLHPGENVLRAHGRGLPCSSWTEKMYFYTQSLQVPLRPLNWTCCEKCYNPHIYLLVFKLGI